MRSPRQTWLIASAIQKDIDNLGLAARQNTTLSLTLYDIMITHTDLRRATRKLFSEQNYALAVEEAFKCLDNFVKKRGGIGESGADLMRQTFSPKKPVLQLSDMKTESQRNQQQGYMEILAGCMTGIRNPRAHAHAYQDDSRAALEMLVMANHLFKVVGSAKRVRRKRSVAVTT